ncbi:PAS domain S-box protein [Nitriliruptoraceae bacterium ZYF776]|nr:PAS domain S-box protein [Profundirhabdus halotolerans]
MSGPGHPDGTGSAPADRARPIEGRRLASLRRLGVLDVPAEPALEELVALTGTVLGADAAALTLVDASRAWTLATTATGGQVSVDRAHSIADRAVVAGEVVVSDVVTDPDLAEHPWCRQDPRLRRVAAAPVAAPDGELVGALEVGWRRVGPNRRDDAGLLGRLARQLGELLELRAEAQEYRRFVELSPDAVTVLDLDGSVELANPAMAALLGLPDVRPLLGRPFLELVVAEDRSRGAAELARVLFARRRTASLDVHLLTADGRSLPVSIAAGHLRGSKRSLQLVVRDVTERQRAEEERARLGEQLARAQRLESTGQLAGGLAHDLNNLLAILVGNLGLAGESLSALRAGEDPQAALQALEEDLGQLRVAATRVDTLTRKLLQFARLEDETPRWTLVVEVVDAVAGLLDNALGPGVRLELDLAPDVPAVHVDPDALEQALVNLVLNARDAMPDGGTVRLSARRGPAVGEAETSAVLTVEDDGVGMDERTQARAFEPLFTTKPKDQGTGLGLASVLGVVERAGGTIQLDSQPGRGTSITLTLPSVVDVEVAEQPTAGPEVLLVDPSDRQRPLIAKMLTGGGYRVREVATAAEALEVLRGAGPVSVLVSEVALGDRLGGQLVDDARDARPGLPAVLLSSGAGEATVGPSDVPVLGKPFASDRLLRMVAAVRAVSGHR